MSIQLLPWSLKLGIDQTLAFVLFYLLVMGILSSRWLFRGNIRIIADERGIRLDWIKKALLVRKNENLFISWKDLKSYTSYNFEFRRIILHTHTLGKITIPSEGYIPELESFEERLKELIAESAYSEVIEVNNQEQRWVKVLRLLMLSISIVFLILTPILFGPLTRVGLFIYPLAFIYLVIKIVEDYKEWI